MQHRFGLTECVSKNEIVAYAAELARRLTDAVRHLGSNDATMQELDELNEAIADLIQMQQLSALRVGLERRGYRLRRTEDVVVPIAKAR